MRSPWIERRRKRHIRRQQWCPMLLQAELRSEGNVGTAMSLRCPSELAQSGDLGYYCGR